MTYFTSDIHDYHKNVLSYCNRPYDTVEEMHEAIYDTWRKTVREEDTIYVLGDVTLNKKWAFKIGNELPGKKILIAGNHDDCWNFEEKSNGEKKRALYLNNGWSEVHMQYSIRLRGHYIHMSHLPPITTDTTKIDQRYLDNRPKYNKDVIYLHGHQHCHYIKNGNLIDVGFDGELTIWSEDDIIKMLDHADSFIPSRVTEFYKSRNNNDPG